jgi:plastocyanin
MPARRALMVVVAAVAVAAILAVTGVAGRGYTAMMGAGGRGAGSMTGGSWGTSGSGPATGTRPGGAGAEAGTPSAPRTIRIVAGPGYAFSPSTITVRAGETVTFQVTTMGPATHEFMVGPAHAVADDVEGTPEIADIAMMQTRSLTYTFDGPGPFAFACHAAGHYEAGMRGTVVVLP